MIINGGAAGNVKWWSDHLQREDTNERAELVETRGVVADNLQDALFEMKWVAAGSRSQGNFMYQANINPCDHERLTAEQWDQAVDALERNMGLDGHQRVVFEHEKHGRVHRHVIWNRVDAETMKVVDIGGNYHAHEQTARQLERDFDLTPTPTPSIADRKAAPELWEHRAAARSGIDPKALKAELTDLWHMADSGRAFVAAVEDRGYIVARGDRRDFCVIDPAGDAHSLARRLDGVKTADLRLRMADVDRDALPTVPEARAVARTRAETYRDLGTAMLETQAELAEWPKPQDPGQASTTKKPAGDRELNVTAGAIRLAYQLSDSGQGFAEGLEACGLHLAVVSPEEAAQSQRIAAFAKELGNYAPTHGEGELVAVNGFGSVYGFTRGNTGDSRAEIAAYLAPIDRSELHNVTQTREEARAASRAAFIAKNHAERPLSDIETRVADLAQLDAGAFIAGMQGEGLYLARATAADVAALATEHQTSFAASGQRAANPFDLQAQEPASLPAWLSSSLDEGQLVAIDSFGGIHRFNPVRIDAGHLAELWTDGADQQFGAIADIASVRGDLIEAREDRAALWQETRDEIAAAKMDRATAVENDGSFDRGDDAGDVADALGDIVAGIAKGGIVVCDFVSDRVEDLADFIAGMFDDGGEEPRGQVERFRASRRSAAAMESITDDLAKGRIVQAVDVRNLSRDQLESIRSGGDQYLIDLAQSIERDRERGRGWER